MGFVALVFRGTRFPAAQDEANSGVLAYHKLNNNLVFYILQGVIKMVRRGYRGSPRTPFQREVALPGPEMRT